MLPDSFPKLTQALLDRGYSEREIRGIMGENFCGVAERGELHSAFSRVARKRTFRRIRKAHRRLRPMRNAPDFLSRN